MDLLTDHILGRIIHADVDTSHIFSDQSQHDHDHAAEKYQCRHQCAEAHRDIGIHQPLDDRINSIEEAETGAAHTERCGDPQRFHGKCRKSVKLENERILKEFIDGDTIYQLVLEDKMKTDYIEQLHRMCALLYAANTNIDYFPTNFVVHNEEIYYVDFECNDYMEEWNFENWGVKYWSKTPEFLQYVKEHS